LAKVQFVHHLYSPLKNDVCQFDKLFGSMLKWMCKKIPSKIHHKKRVDRAKYTKYF